MTTTGNPDRRRMLATIGGSVLGGAILASGQPAHASPSSATAAPAGDVYDITQPPFNANGGDTLGDDAAIQAAIDAASAAGGGTVFFPAGGTYILSTPITVKNNVTLAAGWQRAKIQLAAGFSETTIFRLDGLTRAALSNLDIDCAGKQLDFAVYVINSTGIDIDGLRISNIADVTPGEAVRLTSCTQIRIANCAITSTYGGIAVHGTTSHVLIDRCDLSNVAHRAIWLQGSATTRTEHTTVQHCRISSMVRRGNGVGYPIYYTCGGQNTHRSVRVLYNEIVGNAKPFVRQDGTSGGGNADLIAVYDTDGAFIHGNSATLGGDAGISLDRCRRIIISENITADCNTVGINVYQATDVTVQSNLVYNNYRNFENELAPLSRGGIRVTARDGQVSSFIEISGNRCYDAQTTKTQDYGIYIDGRGRFVTIGANTLDGNSEGMLKSDSTDNISLSFTLTKPSTPTSGYWEKGMVIRNRDFAAGRPLHWVCTASGIPGTWLAI